jgi:hypothetical protein
MTERRTCDGQTAAGQVTELRERVRVLEALLTYRLDGQDRPEIRQALATALQTCSGFPPYGAGFAEALRRYDELVDRRTEEAGHG